ncbi:hypothetical protein ACX0G9_12095 [Flavitalea flava]
MKGNKMQGNKNDNGQDKLRDLLYRQAKALYDEAVQTGGQVLPDKLESLEHLQRLVNLYSSSAPPARRKRWPVIAILAATLAIVSVLLFARVPATEIELDLTLSEVGFQFARQQVFADVMKLSTLGVSGLENIRLPRMGNQDARTIGQADGSDSSGSGTSIQLWDKEDSVNKGTVSLATIILPKGTRVWLRPTEIPLQYRLSVKSTALQLRADVNGQIGMGLPGMPQEKISFTSPRSILLQSGQNIVDMDLGFLHADKNTFSCQLMVDSLSFFRIDEHVDPEHTIMRRVSTILSGTVYFESLGGQERRLRPGEEIDFDWSKGEIRTLTLQDDHIRFAFHGRVRGMTTGVEEHQYSIMPTYLEWLKARHGLSLLWGTTLYFFGLIFGVWRWWKASTINL